ncbi:L,D-transpeptidase family protein [Roseobacter sp. HKCCD9010]|uniref:L,D-transpeptidase n=1 Tax=Rhodobacterales TaxID=204455 RepID=UPI00149168A5|nr:MULTISPECIES: L,D-transpeptidase family protein [Rhodobacterales]MBF9050117.1 L,D-transpeptidase family protein [Rhodobacterales bacterium HKCCD4356]NNV12360.1 L,D-transpeptidase family protein [Roseobacter sp. HKCCD7357]NNV16177.1 L,D-transpeptidase family protein [Roseobacter sp. HKCCD8768]NNV25637.1 L,D-transpeptidase family protein [Roseobacter sp. HKCCD8192]NNV29893.1 L,D-transpeptidase family protein [Roseobacter sp. HKCCD9061]
MSHFKMTRRSMVLASGATLATPMLALAETPAPALRADAEARRNLSSFRSQNWQDHFERLDRVTILADMESRAVHYWSADGTDYRLYPSSIPLTEELTRRGYTEVVRKRVGPDWTPTASMRERDPSLPAYMPPGPDNPLGTHALYLTWPAYLIHGTHDTRKIGRRSSSGCIGLFNEHIAELFALTPTGAQVRLL